MGEDCTAPGGFDDFFGNKAKGVEHLLVRAWRFPDGSLERSSLLMMIDSLIALATQSRGVRRRAAIAGAMHAEHDAPIWMALGSDVEDSFKAITDELKRLEKEASKLLNAMRFSGFSPPPAGMPPLVHTAPSPPVGRVLRRSLRPVACSPPCAHLQYPLSPALPTTQSQCGRPPRALHPARVTLLLGMRKLSRTQCPLPVILSIGTGTRAKGALSLRSLVTTLTLVQRR